MRMRGREFLQLTNTPLAVSSSVGAHAVRAQKRRLDTESAPARRRVGEYQKSGIMSSLDKGGKSNHEFVVDEDF